MQLLADCHLQAVGEGLPRDEIKALREVAFQPTQVYNTTEAVFQVACHSTTIFSWLLPIFIMAIAQ